MNTHFAGAHRSRSSRRAFLWATRTTSVRCLAGLLAVLFAALFLGASACRGTGERAPENAQKSVRYHCPIILETVPSVACDSCR